MRVEQLQTFLAIVETRSFLQAARRCGITQSSASRQIQSLEQDLQTPLFHRSNQAKLTVAGEKLVTHARRICQEWSQAQQEIQELLAGKQPELCIAAIHSVCAYFLPPVLHQFCNTHPQVQLRVTALGSDRALKVMRDGLIDVAIVMQNKLFTNSSDLVVRELYEEPIELMMAADHPLTQIVFKDGYGMQRLIQEQFQRLGAKLRAVVELNSLDAFRGVVQQGDAIALLPRSAMTGIEEDPKLTTRPIEPLTGTDLQSLSLTRQVVMVTTTDRMLLPPIAAFYDLVEQQAALLKKVHSIPKDG
jgi:DNA-binding transcriptional LysR family regulator